MLLAKEAYSYNLQKNIDLYIPNINFKEVNST
jgi:hypothetical protein